LKVSGFSVQVSGVSPAADRRIGQFDQVGKMPLTFSRILTAKRLAPEIACNPFK
jgi:hypothetical protein